MVLIQKIALIAAIILPFMNVPLIIRIIKRKSSGDISIWWALGVWICLVLMAPSGFVSKDFVWKLYNIINFILFSLTVICVFWYRKTD